MRFDNHETATNELMDRFKDAAEDAGLPVYDVGYSAQSCSRYVEFYDEDTEAEFTVRFSDHAPKACVSEVNHDVQLAAMRLTTLYWVYDADCNQHLLPEAEIEDMSSAEYAMIEIDDEMMNAAITDAVVAARAGLVA